jgi:hypothetical protein
MSPQDTSPAPKRFDTGVLVEISICVFLIVVFLWMYAHSYEWEIEAALFPRMISGLGIVSVLAYLAQIIWRNRKGHDGRGRRILDIPWAKVAGDARSVQRKAIGVIAWSLGFWIGIWLVGFHIAAPVYLYSQMVIYGGVRKWVSALAAGVCLATIIGVYDRLAETTWNDPVLFDFVKGVF